MIVSSDNSSTTNSEAVSLKIVKPEKIPIEENFHKVYITSQESKSCCSNCLSKLDNFDKKISFPLQNYTPSIFLEIIFFIGAKIFNTLTIIMYLVFLLIYCIFIKKNLKIFLIYFCHVVIGALLTLFTKIIIGRERPTLTAKRYFDKVRKNETTNSMPSGDSLQAANFAMIMILYLEGNIKFLSLLLIPYSMIGRVFYNCHYWFDCLVGAFMGIFVSLGTYYFIIYRFNINKYNLNI